MGVFVLTDASVVLNSVDLSDHITKTTLHLTRDDVDTTAFSATAHTRTGGLMDGTVEFEFNQDFAASKVDATLWAAFIGGVPVSLVIKPTSSAVGSTNPSFTGTVLVNDYSPIDGQVGDLAKTSPTWPISGAVARATS